MIVIHRTVDVGPDRKLVIDLPPEVPIGPAKITITFQLVSDSKAKKRPRSSLADWAEANAENYGSSNVRSDDIDSFTGRKFPTDNGSNGIGE